MALKPDDWTRALTPLSEDDPLPPHDRLVLGSALALEQLYQAQAPRLTRFFARRTEASRVSRRLLSVRRSYNEQRKEQVFT